MSAETLDAIGVTLRCQPQTEQAIGFGGLNLDAREDHGKRRGREVWKGMNLFAAPDAQRRAPLQEKGDIGAEACGDGAQVVARDLQFPPPLEAEQSRCSVVASSAHHGT